MEANKLIAGIVAAAIAVIVLAGVLMPVLDDATTTNETFTNKGMWRMSPSTNGDTYTYDNSTHEWSLNGTVVNDAYNSTYSFILLDDCTIRTNGWIRGAQLTGNSVTTVVTNANDQTVISGNGLSGNGTYDIQGYGANPNGSYLLTDYTKPVYMNGDSKIYATGLTTITGYDYNAIFHIEGSIDDGVTISPYVVRGTSYTVTDVTIDNIVMNYESVDGFKDLYKLSGITFDYSATVTSNSDPSDIKTVTDFACSYSSYVVPYQVTAERSQHLSDGMNAMLNIIPIMIIIAILLGVVAIFMIRRE